MERNEILQRIDRLLVLYRSGALGGAIMPEDANPGLKKGSVENYLYFTLPMALNYRRSCYALWESALKTYRDPETRFVFDPAACLNHTFEDTQAALTKHKVALQRQKQMEIWLALCRTFVKFFNGDIRRLFDHMDNDVNRIRRFIQVENKKRFPYLSGTKICNYWMYVIWQYTDRSYCNPEALTVAPDTHVCKTTHQLGLITETELNSTGEEKLNKLLEAMRRVPSTVNRQAWLFYVIVSPKMKARMAKITQFKWSAWIARLAPCAFSILLPNKRNQAIPNTLLIFRITRQSDFQHGFLIADAPYDDNRIHKEN